MGPGVAVFNGLALGLSTVTMNVLFHWTLVTALVLIPMVVIRCLRDRELAADPTLTILIAPAALVVVALFGYLGFQPRLDFYCTLYGLLLVSLLFFFLLLCLRRGAILQRGFTPEWASHTFPVVIFAIATTRFYQYITVTNSGSSEFRFGFKVFAAILTTISALLCVGVSSSFAANLSCHAPPRLDLATEHSGESEESEEVNFNA